MRMSRELSSSKSGGNNEYKEVLDRRELQKIYSQNRGLYLML